MRNISFVGEKSSKLSWRRKVNDENNLQSKLFIFISIEEEVEIKEVPA